MDEQGKIREEEFCVCWARDGRVMTPREEEILREIRAVRNEYDELKKMLTEVSAMHDEERRRIEDRLDQLRARREELEKLRIEAARERMKLLGHED